MSLISEKAIPNLRKHWTLVIEQGLHFFKNPYNGDKQQDSTEELICRLRG